MLPLQRPQVWSLIGELRFHMPCRKKEKTKEERERGREEGRERKSVTTSNLRKDVRFEYSAKDGREFPEDGQVRARGTSGRRKTAGKRLS